MARIFLERDEKFVVAQGGHRISGRSGEPASGSEGEGVLILPSVLDSANPVTKTNAAVERLDTPFGFAEHTFQVTENGLEIAVDGRTIATGPSLNQDLDFRTADGNVTLSQTRAQTYTAANPNDPSDTATIGTEPVTPAIGTGDLVAETSANRNLLDIGAEGPVDEGGTATFMIELDKAAEQEVAVDYAIAFSGGAGEADLGAVAAGGESGSGLEGTLTLPPSETETTIAVEIAGDSATPEDGEAVAVTLSNARGSDAVGLGSASARIAITDAPLTFDLIQATEDVGEGATATYEVRASAPVADETDVAFRVEPGDAAASDQGTNTTNLNDFSQGAFNPSATTIAAGEQTTSFKVGTQDEGLTELPEDFDVVADVADRELRTTTTLLDGGAEGRVFGLTPDADALRPDATDPANQTTNGPDTFRAASDGDFDGADIIKAGAGTDTVEAVFTPDGNQSENIAPTLESVERVLLDAEDVSGGTGSTVTFDGSDSSGTEVIGFSNLGDPMIGADDQARVEGVASDIVVGFKDAVGDGLSGGAGGIVEYDGVSGSGDSATVALHDSELFTPPPDGSLEIPGIEDLTLAISGDEPSVLGSLEAPEAETLTIAGNRPVVIASPLASNAAAIDTLDVQDTATDVTFAEDGGTGGSRAPAASVITGALGHDVTFDGGPAADKINAGAMTGGNGLTARLGEGNDRAVLGAGSATVSGGGGGDTIFLNGNLSASDSIDGGGGTDIVIDDAAELDGLENDTARLAALTSIEGIGIDTNISLVGDGRLDFSNLDLAGERFVITKNAAIDTTATISELADGATIVYKNDANFTGELRLRVPEATSAGNFDDTLTFVSETDVSGVENDVKLDILGIETLNVESRDTDDASPQGGIFLDLANAVSLETVDIGGDANTVLDVTSTTSGLAGLKAIDAADSEGNVTVNLTGSQFLGGTGVAIATGAGDDQITGTDFTDNLATGDGADTLVYDEYAFGHADRLTDFSSGEDRFIIDLTKGGTARVDNGSIESTAATPTVGPATTVMAPSEGLQFYTIGGGTTAKGLSTSLSTNLLTSVITLTSALLFKASTFGALASAVSSVIANNATMTRNVGLALGLTESTSRLHLFRVSDTSAMFSFGTRAVTNTIATIGGGTVAASDIAIF